MSSSRRSFFVPPGQGRVLDVLGQHIIYKVKAEHTSGAYALAEGVAAPHSLVPKHVHRREDEGFYVLEGALEIECGGERFTALAGSFVLLPRGVPHALRNATGAAARLLCVQSPAGVETFFEHLSALGEAGRPDPAEVESLMERYEVELASGNRPVRADRRSDVAEEEGSVPWTPS
jgi:quercetin dioxygenase-like cupin family protein